MSGVRNADITLYHREYDPEQSADVWSRVQYRGVSWHGGRAVTSGTSGDTAADAYVVRIFTNEAVSAEPGDIVVRGLVEDEITGTAQLTQKYAESWRVTGVRDDRRGGLPHWRIEGA